MMRNPTYFWTFPTKEIIPGFKVVEVQAMKRISNGSLRDQDLRRSI